LEKDKRKKYSNNSKQNQGNEVSENTENKIDKNSHAIYLNIQKRIKISNINSINNFNKISINLKLRNNIFKKDLRGNVINSLIFLNPKK